MSTNHMYFNLFDFIKTLPQAYVAGHAARTVAWRIDSLIVSAARSILRNVRDKMSTGLVHGIDDRAEQLRELALKDTAEKWFELTGKDNAGEIETIRWLNAMRDQWQDLAKDLTSLTCDWKGQPRVYEIEELEDAFLRDPNMKINSQTRRRMKMSSSRMAEAYGMPEMADAFLKRRVEREQDRLERMTESMKETAPLAFSMCQLAIECDKFGDDEDLGGVKFKSFADLRDFTGKSAQERMQSGFSSLPISIQRTLIDTAVTAIQRADEYAASERSMTDMEYDHILACVLSSTKTLQQVLKSPRFVRHAQQEAAGETQTG